MKRRILVVDNIELLTEKRDWDIWARDRVDYLAEPIHIRQYLASLKNGTYSAMVVDPIRFFANVGGFEAKKTLFTALLAEVNTKTTVIYTIDKGEEMKIAGFKGAEDFLTRPYYPKLIVDRF